MSSAESQARWRKNKAKAGFCITCGKRKARKGRKTCQKCADAAKERVKRLRAP